MFKHYSCAILGASFLGVGAYLTSDDEVILIEPSASAGYEFIEAYHPGAPWLWDDKYKDDSNMQNFYFDIEKKNLIASGRVHLPGIGPLLFGQINKSKKTNLFYTSIVSIIKKGNIYEIKLYNRSGYTTVTANRILDTTNQFISRPDIKTEFKYRSFQALLESNDNNGDSFYEKTLDYEIIPGRFPKEAYLSIPLSSKEGFVEAREQLQALWLNKKYDLRKRYSLLSTSVCFREVPVLKSSEYDWHWCPSTQYSNGLESFFAGLKMAIFEPVKQLS